MKRTKSFTNNEYLLYLIATPIGNLKEISARALEIFNEMDIIAAEDTRNTKQLLLNYGIKKELFSLREHNEIEASNYLINLIKNGKKVAYVSDAGYPGISDPGALLVRECLKNDIAVSTISGSSAFINALVASGLETDHFYYYGFLPAKENEARDILKNLVQIKDTLLFYESPHRIFKTLQLMLEELGNRKIVLARELTKINEEYIRGNIQELLEIDPATIKGEMVILVEGNKNQSEINDDEISEKIGYLLSFGLSKKDVVEIINKFYKLNKNYIKKLINF